MQATIILVVEGDVSCDPEDKPDFYALMRRRTAGLCVWCFDLLTLNGSDLRSMAKLGALLAKTDDTTLRLSQTFEDGENCSSRLPRKVWKA